VTASPYEVPPPAGTPPASQPVTAGKPLIVSGIVALAVGVVLGIVSFVLLIGGAVQVFGSQLSAQVTPLPGTAILQLDPGTYGIYVTDSGAGVAIPDAFTVTGPAGDPVPTHDPTTSEDVSLPQGDFFVLLEFEAQHAGTYQVTAQPADGTGGQFVVARTLTSAFTDRGWWGLGIVGGGLLVVLGVVLLAVGLTQRRRARQALAPAYPGGGWTPYPPGGGYPGYQQPYAQQPYPQQPYVQPQPQPQPQPAGPPAGWYADPGRPGGQRYWDGTRWTDHTA
jgi:Protein of unknown function (DUF2510)